MKKILIITLLLLSGCQKETIAVNDIWDDVPEINITSRDIDFKTISKLDGKLQAWGIGANTDEVGQPIDCINANSYYSKYDAHFIEDANNEIYLTFDNGYENGNTPAILDTLKEKDVHGVFFLTAQYVLENEDLVQRMIDEGHIIGNHSYHHPSFPTISDEKIVDEIMDMDDLMIERFQYKMSYIRPPRGEYSERSLAISQALGYTSLFWSFAYYDYNVNEQPDTASSLTKCLDNAHPGAIYLFHCVSNTNMQILGDFIDGIRELNYKFKEFE